MEKNIEIAIIGLGRFGSFWGKHLSKYYPVYGYDSNIERKEQVQSFIVWNNLEDCLQKDFIFITTPIRSIEKFLKENTKRFAKESVVIDCASVKLCVVDWLERYLPQETYFAACHPLFGPDSAKMGLKKQQISLQPGRIPYVKYQQLVNIFRDDLELNILNLTADEHDRLMAYNLSFIHHLGRTFHSMEIFKVPLMMAGLEKLNHISGVVMNDADELFQDFYRYNPYANEVKEKFVKSFEKIDPL